MCLWKVDVLVDQNILDQVRSQIQLQLFQVFRKKIVIKKNKSKKSFVCIKKIFDFDFSIVNS